MAQNFHGPWIATALNGALTAAKIKLWISGTINPDHQYMSDVDGSEASTTGYTSGFAGTAITCSGLGVTYDSTNNRCVLAGTAGTFTAIGVPAGYSVTLARMYIPGSSYSDSKVIASFDCAIALNGGNFTIAFNAVGIGTISV